MFSTRLAIGAVCALVLCNTASAIVLIDDDTRNGSFELLGGALSTAKAIHWDTDPNGDVDNWTLWDAGAGGPATASDDSGTDTSGSPDVPAGEHVAFLQGNNAAFNDTDYIVQSGDVFYYTWDWVFAGRSNAIAQLAYESSPGVFTAITNTDSASEDVVATIDHVYTVMPGDPAIGNAIALTIAADGSGYPEVDHFFLSVNDGNIPVDGDVDGDGDVDLADYAFIRDNFRTGTTLLEGDLTGNGAVDFDDFLEWRANYTPSSLSNATAIPEPTTGILGLLGVLSLLAYRKQ